MADFVSAVRDALRIVGYVADDALAAQIALLLCQNGGSVRAMLLDGPPGAGKTHLAKSVARIMGVDHYYIQAHPGSVPEDFLYDANIVSILRGLSGDTTAVQSAEDVVQLGFLPQIFLASQAGPVVAFVDELDKASPKTDSLFLAALQEGEVVVNGYGRIQANLANLILFFTKNNERQISEPLMRRCRRHYLGFPAEALELAILMGEVQAGWMDEPLVVPYEPVSAVGKSVGLALVMAANKLRELQEDIIKPPATQELVLAGHDIVRLHRWGRMDQIGEVVAGWLAAYPEDREVMKDKVITAGQIADVVKVAMQRDDLQIVRQQMADIDDEFVRFNAPSPDSRSEYVSD